MKSIGLILVFLSMLSCGKEKAESTSQLNDVVGPLGEVNSYRGKLIFEMLDKREIKHDGSRKFTIHIDNVKVIDTQDIDTFKSVPDQMSFALPVSVRKDGSREIRVSHSGILTDIFTPASDDFEFKVKIKRIDVRQLKVKDRDGAEYPTLNAEFKVTALNSQKCWDTHCRQVQIMDEEIKNWWDKEGLGRGIDVPVGLKYRVDSYGYSKSGDLVHHSAILD